MYGNVAQICVRTSTRVIDASEQARLCRWSWAHQYCYSFVDITSVLRQPASVMNDFFNRVHLGTETIYCNIRSRRALLSATVLPAV